MLKEKLLNIYTFAKLSKNKIEENQQKIRDVEWEAIQKYIPERSKFIDVGCGAGYAMKKAVETRNCEVKGIDPSPGEHGVGRYAKNKELLNIQKGDAENIPFDNNTFDVVYCSHVLEHVSDMQKALSEMYRVLKSTGVLIIGIPTAEMAKVNLYTNIMFTTHIRWFNILLKPFINTAKSKWFHFFIPSSHSDFNKSVLWDIKNYKIRKWEKIVSNQFNIEKTLLPAYYPFPEYIQWFKLKTNYKKSSSVFFIAHKH